MKKGVKRLFQSNPRVGNFIDKLIVFFCMVFALYVFLFSYFDSFSVNFSISNASGQLRTDLQFLALFGLFLVLFVKLEKMEEILIKLSKKK